MCPPAKVNGVWPFNDAWLRTSLEEARRQTPRNVASILDSARELGIRDAQHRQANAALYRIVIVRMRWHQPTIDYVARRTLQGLSKKDILRCLSACELDPISWTV